MDEPISVEEAGALLGVSARRVRVFVSQGRLPAIRIGRRVWAISRRDAQEFARQARPAGRPRGAAAAIDKPRGARTVMQELG